MPEKALLEEGSVVTERREEEETNLYNSRIEAQKSK